MLKNRNSNNRFQLLLFIIFSGQIQNQGNLSLCLNDSPSCQVFHIQVNRK